MVTKTPLVDKYFASRIPDMEENTDYIIIFGGTNDFGHGDSEFGCMSDRDENTFYGALHSLYTKISTKYPMYQIIVITPTHRLVEEIKDCMGKNRKLIDYVNAIIEVAAYYGIPVLDLYRTGGMCPHIPKLMQIYMPDGLHPSDEGNKIIYNRLKSMILKL